MITVAYAHTASEESAIERALDAAGITYSESLEADERANEGAVCFLARAYSVGERDADAARSALAHVGCGPYTRGAFPILHCMTLDEVIAALYASFSFEERKRPNYELQREIFAPGARLVRVNDEGVFEFDLASFRENLEHMIDSGAMTSFWEKEVWREVQEFGDVAHVLSEYETPLFRAVKSIQLFRRDGRWWISAMIWRRDREM